MKQDEKKKTIIVWIVLLVCLLFLETVQVRAADMEVFEGVHGVTISPDKTAWTTDYLDRTNEHLQEGYTVYTGQTSKLRSLKIGEHYYETAAKGALAIGKWTVAWSNAQCIHENPGFTQFCGFPIKSDTICYAYYNNGWYAYCADCGELVEELLFYGTEATIKGILSIPASSVYAYICPYCEGLEQGRSYAHICKAISNNYYEIVYNANAPENKTVTGFMASTKHMYDNAELYNGTDAKTLGYANTTLRKNVYECQGYEFAGWNTQADGNGRFLEDGAEVLNLGSVDGEKIQVYAQWKKTQSGLCIDANGGTYKGKSIFEVYQGYGTTYEVENKYLVPADGYRVHFETNGGSKVADQTTKKEFAYWKLEDDFEGTFEQNIYTFLGSQQHKDTIKAEYVNESFVLPDSVKENASLAGWYTSPEFQDETFIGRAGDLVTVDRDVTLYAKWSTLTLWAYDDYESNDGKGAVDLKWEQKDGKSKFYRLFQSMDKTNWNEIFSADTSITELVVEETFDTKQQGKEYIIPHTGYYVLTAQGAKGADYSTNKKGGKGGMVSAEYWLQKGDVVSFYAGTMGTDKKGGTNKSNSYGGSSTDVYGSGGGAATEVYVTRNKTKTLLLVAGGGGGGNEKYAGGAGGQTLSSVANQSGKESAYGGGGGGAIGGDAGGTLVVTTKEDTTDYAFKSNMSKNLNAGSFQVYGMDQELETPSLRKTTGNGQNDWKWITQMGSLTKTFQTNYSLWYNDAYSAFFGKETGEAAVGKVPYIQVQARDGVSMSMSQTYETNGNTHLLLSGGLFRQDYGAPGITKLHISVNDADTGATLFQNCIYNGYSNNDKAGIASVIDVGISSAKRITVRIASETEGTQEETDGHKTQLYFSDIIFYGKTVSNAKEALGGTSYINTAFGCKNQQSSAGVNNGNGFAHIKGTDIGYQEVNALDDVFAQDYAKPDAVTVYTKSLIGADKIKVTFTKPKDYGTTYYHMAKSYCLEKEKVKQLAVSNITENTLTTGVKGYYYYVDTKSHGTVSDKNTFLLVGEETISVELTNPVMYVHIAAVDGAGNIGETTHIRLEIDLDIPTDETYAKQIPLYTTPITLKESEFVYKTEEQVYYVKADGMTVHQIVEETYMGGAATKDYQIEQVYFCLKDQEQWAKIIVPYADIADNSVFYAGETLSTIVSDTYCDYMNIDSMQAQRTEHAKNLQVLERFTVSKDTDSFVVYPRAAATLLGTEYFSDEQQDKKHELTIIPDGIVPQIEGMESLAQWDVLDMTEQTTAFELKASDFESGLKEFVVTVKNKDNLMTESFEADSDGKILLQIDKENALFQGEIVVTATAIDHVGNANIMGEDGLTFTLDTLLYKERNPEETIFKTGETAVLDIKTTGYVERLEIEYPEELLEHDPNLPTSYEYEVPYLKKTETIKFEIPLGMEEKEYKITIKAYKNGKMLVSKQTLMVVEGNVLDELRTRIRNNG